MLFTKLLQLLCYHLPGNGIDGISSRRLFQTGFCDNPDAWAAGDMDAFFFLSGYPGINPGSIGYVRIVSGIFFNGAGYNVCLLPDIPCFQMQMNAFGRDKTHIICLFACQKHTGGGLCCGGRTASSGVAEAQFLVVYGFAVIFYICQ